MIRRIRLFALLAVIVLSSFGVGIAYQKTVDPSGTPKKLWTVHAHNGVSTSTYTYWDLPGMKISYNWPYYGPTHLLVTISIMHKVTAEEGFIDLRLVVDGKVRDEIYFSGKTHDRWQTQTAVFVVEGLTQIDPWHVVTIQWRRSGAGTAWAWHRVLAVEAFY